MQHMHDMDKVNLSYCTVPVLLEVAAVFLKVGGIRGLSVEPCFFLTATVCPSNL